MGMQLLKMVADFVAGFLGGLLANITYDLLKRHFQKKDDP